MPPAAPRRRLSPRRAAAARLRLLRSRATLNRALREKTEALERARSGAAGRAVAEERARIAGELHHVVAHALSAMTVQASAARHLTAAAQVPRGEGAGRLTAGDAAAGRLSSGDGGAGARGAGRPAVAREAVA
jgi:hypothetical protein